MGGKKGKKSKGKKKGASDDDAGEDDSTERLYSLYAKKSTELGATVPAKLREKFDDALDEAVFLTEVTAFHNSIDKHMGPGGMAGGEGAGRRAA